MVSFPIENNKLIGANPVQGSVSRHRQNISFPGVAEEPWQSPACQICAWCSATSQRSFINHTALGRGSGHVYASQGLARE